MASNDPQLDINSALLHQVGFFGDLFQSFIITLRNWSYKRYDYGISLLNDWLYPPK